jgi:hypothetical protein
VRSIFLREVAAYQRADVVLTITDDDKEKMLMTLDQEFELLTRLVYNEQVRECLTWSQSSWPLSQQVEFSPLTELGTKFQVVRYALSPSEIIPDQGKRLRYEGGGVMDGTKRSQLSFVGNGANPTNKEAMAWFLDKILDMIKEKHQDMKLIIIGAPHPSSPLLSSPLNWPNHRIGSSLRCWLGVSSRWISSPQRLSGDQRLVESRGYDRCSVDIKGIHLSDRRLYWFEYKEPLGLVERLAHGYDSRWLTWVNVFTGDRQGPSPALLHRHNQRRICQQSLGAIQ